MRRFVRISVFFLSLVLASAQRAHCAEFADSQEFPAGCKVALVLSGGGAKGIAHMAVIEALEKHGIVPDLVVGTSIGALVGGLYASGMDSGQLVRIALEEDIFSLFALYPPAPMSMYDHLDTSGAELASVGFRDAGLFGRTGMIDDFYLMSFFNRKLYPGGYKSDFDKLAIPFRAVAYDVGRRQRAVFSDGSLAEAMRASMGIPLVFQIFKTEDGDYVDGGLADNIPISVAQELGANVVITSDVSSKKDDYDDSLFSFAVQLISQVNRMRYSLVDPEKNSDILVNHDVEGIGLMDFNDAEDILDRARRTMAGFDGRLADLAERIRRAKTESGGETGGGETGHDGHDGGEGAGHFAAGDRLKVSFVTTVELTGKDAVADRECEKHVKGRFAKYEGRAVDEGFFSLLEKELDDERRMLDLDVIRYSLIETDGSGGVELRISYILKKSVKYRLSVMESIGFDFFQESGSAVAFGFDPSAKVSFHILDDREKMRNSFSLSIKKDGSLSLGYSLTMRNRLTPFYMRYHASYGIGDFFVAKSPDIGDFFSKYDHNFTLGADFYLDTDKANLSLGAIASAYLESLHMRETGVNRDSAQLYARMRAVFFDPAIPKVVKDDLFTICVDAAAGADFSLSGAAPHSFIWLTDLRIAARKTIADDFVAGFDASLFINRFPSEIRTNHAKYSYFSKCFFLAENASGLYSVTASFSRLFRKVSFGALSVGLSVTWMAFDDAGAAFAQGSSADVTREDSVSAFPRFSSYALAIGFEAGFDAKVLSVVVGFGYDVLSNGWMAYVRL